MEENIISIYNAYNYANDVVNNVIVPSKEIDYNKFTLSTFDKKHFEITNECIIFEESSIKKLQDVYKNFNSKSRTISSKDKLYFISATKFPRTHLSLYSDLKRVIKADKCDKLVIPNTINCNNLGPHIKLDTDKYITFHEWVYDSYIRNNKLTNTPDTFKRFCIFLFPFLKYDEIEIINPYRYYISEPDLNLIINNESKLIKGDDITKYISSNLQTMDFEEYETLNEMLASEDKAIINMAIKMLGNYNIDKSSDKSSGIYIGLMLYNNRHNMWRVSKTTVFKYIEDTLGLHVNKIPRYGEELYLYKIKEFSKNTEQVEFISKIIKEYEESQK